MTEEQRKLVEDNHDLIYYVLNRNGLSVDEYYGDAAIGLCQAAIAFNPDKGKFSTLAYKCIINNIRVRMRSDSREVSKISIELPLNTGDTNDTLNISDTLEDRSSKFEETLAIKCLLEQYKNKLTPREYEIVRLLYLGVRQSEIANILNIKKQYISILVQKIRRKLRAELMDVLE